VGYSILNYDKATPIIKQESIYTICSQCEWNGIPNQKIVLVYLGTRPVDELGFIYKFIAYDYSQNGVKVIHRHKYDHDTINQLLNQIFDRIEVNTL
jgi:hypothetical protein